MTPDLPLLPDRLRELWERVEAGEVTRRDFVARQRQWTSEYAAIWEDALTLPDSNGLCDSICAELVSLGESADSEETERRCREAVSRMRDLWHETVRSGSEEEIREYYDKNRDYIFELMWWHTLAEDDSPLAYVCALLLAGKNNCSRVLDFGAGVGSGGLLFARHGFKITLADISSTLLDFSERRLRGRGVAALYIDLKSNSLPESEFDFITAMDVFEHIVAPEQLVDQLADALQPGGILFGRFHAQPDAERPSHVTCDFKPTFQRLSELGFQECWRDSWLWGHQAFQKPD